MSKTLYALAKGGLVKSSRGPAGGFVLARVTDAVSIADIVAIFAELPHTQRCLLGTSVCNAAKPCTAHYRWSSVRCAAQTALAATTLADLLSDVNADANPSVSAVAYHPSGTAGAL
jgi:Rrf2 family iron-sulfur cluster assembly transcriptional regulator